MGRGEGDRLTHAPGREGGRYPRLHPGPGRSRAEVASNQRARICAAMIDLAAERGYGAVTVRDLVRRAGVSSHTFYEHFTGREDCLLAAYRLLARRSARRVAATRQGGGDWRERVELACGAWAGGIASDPAAARVALVEVFAGGPAALAWMRQVERSFEEVLGKGFACAPDGVTVAQPVLTGVVAGVHHVARARLLADRALELPQLAEELLEWALCFRHPAASELAHAARAVRPPGGALRAGEAESGACAGERAAILDATARLAAREGCYTLSVPRICAAAGISRRRFHAYFANARACLLAVLEHRAARMRAHVAAAAGTSETWPGAVHRGLCALSAEIACDPALARLAFVDVFAAGLDGMRCEARLIDDVAQGFRAGAPAGQRPGELAAEASAGAIWGIVHRCAMAGAARRLPRAAPFLSFLALAPAIGAEAAVAAIKAECAAAGGEISEARAVRPLEVSGRVRPAGRPGRRSDLAGEGRAA